ncbi:MULTISPECIES: hypothetical protein [unclassified Acidovorax]|uniref:hypothetical protein n=1 Tax=unclassified Acidovorax TaxID=2684926 RepID=UPI001C43E42B|nr:MULTISPECIES: hypothetical protein [unclassified Acidovorax]MBV7427265.1 hypothetical protein [Acidovorax sp. sif0732]MBV7448389.1 hypothetical protein [Acidovorax sp. sif0715]
MIALPTLSPTLLALGISLAVNAGLSWAYLGQRDETTAAAGQRDQARADATACSDAVDDLRELASNRNAAAAPARAAASAAAQGLNARADYTLGLQPKVPGDMCASMQALGDEWLQGRGRK